MIPLVDDMMASRMVDATSTAGTPSLRSFYYRNQFSVESVPNAGSFIRPSAPLYFGRSFLAALAMKYVETEHGSRTPEKIVLGSSNGAIEVEAVGLDKVRRNLGNLHRLRLVSLDCELVASADAEGDVLAACPSEISGHLLTL